MGHPSVQPETPHLYLLGIGGVGMAWVADWALQQGWRVSGSDVAPSPLTERLLADGAEIHYGCDPLLIPADVTRAVITSAITPSAPSYLEYQELQRRGVRIEKRAVFIGAITRQYTTIAVAGTHGKTTTTAMIGWLLEKAGLDPTVFVGGSLAAWGGRTRIGASKYLVIEADEFDRSFHQFSATIAVLLNLEADHLDYYTEGITEIEHSFRRFLRNLPHRSGMVIGYGRDKHLRKVVKGFAYKQRWYDESRLWSGLKLDYLPGTHNLLNATAAARVAHELGVEQDIILRALRSFPGVGRRFERMGKQGVCDWIDDYAHHPTEVAATLQAVAEWAGGRPRTVIFQPHQKARTKLLLKEFGRCFDAHPPERLILAPIYTVAGRENTIEVESDDIAVEIAKRAPKGMQVMVASTLQEVVQLMKEAAGEPGVIVSMSAGNLRSTLMEGRSA